MSSSRAKILSYLLLKKAGGSGFRRALKRAPDRLRFRFPGSFRDRFPNEPAVPTRTLLKFAVIGIFYSQVVS